MSVFNTSRLAGKTVLITGASAGIGAATAQLFAKTGSNLVLLARRAENLKAVKSKCEAAHKAFGSREGGKVVIIEADMQKNKDLDAVPNKLEGLQVDILVNNAGLVKGREHVGADTDVNTMFSTNVLGLIHLTQIFVRQFKERNAGTIINLGSIAGREPYAGASIYCATKHALTGFNSALMKELVNTPIRIAEIQPGMVETEFSLVRFRGDKDAADTVYKGLQPLVAEDIAEEIVWVASRPPHVNIAQLFVLPVNQASPTLAHRS
nr:malonic semialdehyde reductase [Cryptococcus depauperatus CBS 7855]